MPEPDDDRALVRFFRMMVQRPVAVLVLSLALIGMSWIASQRIPIEMVPRGLTGNEVQISADWPGALPSEIEERIVKPLEKELRSVQGVEELTSYSWSGGCAIQVEFPGNVNMDFAYAEVADRVERARPLLPPEVDRVRVGRFTMSAIPVMFFAVIEPEGMDHDEVQDLVTDVLLPRIEAVDGVARARGQGLEPSSVRIWLDEERVIAQRVDIGDLVRRLQGDNLSGPSGDLEDAGSRFLVRVDGRFHSLQEIEEFPVRPGLLLKDVGRVEQVRSAPEFFFRVNGAFTISIGVEKETGANTFALCSEIQRVLDEELPKDPRLARLDYVTYFNQGSVIGTAIRDLVRDTAIGGGIAVLVLWAFLRRLSYTLLITLSIPFAVLITLAWLYFTGDSLNLFTMMGITISVGMLVDCAVVVAESIFKRREQGEESLASVTRGPSEVMLAIVTSTATTIAVFLPFMLLTDDKNARVFSTAIGGPLCIALVSSLLIAIVMVPTAARFLQHRGRRTDPGAAAAARPSRMTRMLGTLVEFSLRRRLIAAAVGLLFLASFPVACSDNGFSEQAGGFGGGQIEADFELRVDQDLDRAYAEVQGMEAVLLGEGFEARYPDVTIGIGFHDRGGEMMIWPDRPMHPNEQEELLLWLAENLPRRSTVEYHFGKQYDQRSAQNARWTRVRIEGPDSRVVQELVDEVRRLAAESSDFSEVSRADDLAREVTVSLDREAMQRLGANSQAVLGNIEWNLRGFMISRFQTARSDIPIILEYDKPGNPDRGDLTGMEIGTAAGMVPLSAFAAFADARSTSTIVRRDGRISDSVGLRTGDEDIRRNYLAVERLMSGVEMPEGYRWTQDGGWEEFQRQNQELMRGLFLALALVFLLMGVLFDSLILPLCAILTVPFGILGAVWAYKLTGTPIGVLEVMALAVLSGVVVNNGIVLIDRILQNERLGQPRREAIVRAVQDRARPVLMTALTTICGLLPIAFGEPSGDGFSFKGLAVGVCAGIAVSTFFTLWSVPLLYSLMRSLGEWLSHWFTGRPLPPPASPRFPPLQDATRMPRPDDSAP